MADTQTAPAATCPYCTDGTCAVCRWKTQTPSIRKGKGKKKGRGR